MLVSNDEKERENAPSTGTRVNESLNLNKEKGGIPAMRRACFGAPILSPRWNFGQGVPRMLTRPGINTNR